MTPKIKVPGLSQKDVEIIIIIVVVIGLGFTVYKILKFFGLVGQKPEPQVTAVDNIKVDPSKLTISTTDLLFKTDELYQAMDQFGTDEDTIMDVFKSLKSGDELLYIIKSFGVKKYFMGTHSGILGSDLNLVGWLKNELSDSYISQISTIWKKLGVNML
jgi:hypothetical protein